MEHEHKYLRLVATAVKKKTDSKTLNIHGIIPYAVIKAEWNEGPPSQVNSVFTTTLILYNVFEYTIVP